MIFIKKDIAIKSKTKKGLIFFAMLLSIFTFNGAVSIAQQTTSGTQPELVLPARRVAVSSVSYWRVVRAIHNRQYSLAPDCKLFAIAIANLNCAVATQKVRQCMYAAPGRLIFRQAHNHIPTDTEPPHQA